MMTSDDQSETSISPTSSMMDLMMREISHEEYLELIVSRRNLQRVVRTDRNSTLLLDSLTGEVFHYPNCIAR